MLRTFFAVSLAALLAACGSTAPTRYYRLPDSTVRLPAHGGTAVKVELAEALRGRGLMYQMDEHTVHFAQKNLWAEPLSDSAATALANKLNRLGGGHYLPQQHADGKQPVLKVYFDRFQGRFDGRAEIGGYAQYADGSRRNFRAFAVQQGDGHEAMVAALDAALDEAVRQIAP